MEGADRCVKVCWADEKEHRRGKHKSNLGDQAVVEPAHCRCFAARRRPHTPPHQCYRVMNVRLVPVSLSPVRSARICAEPTPGREPTNEMTCSSVDDSTA